MPTPILRAGPFASSSDSFLNEPDPIVATTVPVNCGVNNWVSDSWKAYVSCTGQTTDYLENLPQTVSFSLSGVGDQDGQIQFAFRYQAAADTAINIDADCAAASLSGTLTRIEIVVGSTTVYDVSNTGGSSSVSFDDDVSLPASVLPALAVVIITAEASSSGTNVNTSSGSITVSVPA